jgi:hypothetical protein
VTTEQALPTGDIGVDEIDEDLVMRFRSTVAAVELDGEAVLLDSDSGAVHTLNPTATLVWLCCDGTARLGEIIDDLSEVFADAGRQVIAADVLELARTIGRLGLLEGVRAELPETEHNHHQDDARRNGASDHHH